MEKDSSNLNHSFDEDFSISVQKKFLSLLVFDRGWADFTGFSIITPKCFENQILSNICYWIHSYHKKYTGAPTKAACCKMMEDFINEHHLGTKDYYVYKQYIDDIFELQETDDLEFFKQKAIDFTRKVAWENLLKNGTDTLRAGNYEDAINAFRKVLLIGSESDLGLDMSTLTMDEFMKGLSESYDKENMLSTGIEEWDAALNGGFVKNNIHLICAPPGGGKSRTMAYLAKHALTMYKKVIFITLELNEHETMANIYTSATGMTLRDMMDIRNREEFTYKLNMFKNTFNPNIVVKFFKPNAITTDTIHNFIYKIMQEKKEKFGIDWKPDVIFIDYMDKLLPTQKMRGNAYEDGGLVATDCKNLAISFSCVLVTASQLGRYTWSLQGDNVVTMDSVAESAQKVHLAHSMTTLNANPAEKENNKVRLYIAKSRTGTPGKIIFCENNLGKCNLKQIEPWDPNTLMTTQQYSVKDPNTRK